MNYKKYIKETYDLEDIITESPSDVLSMLNRYEDDSHLNSKGAEDIEKNSKLIGNFEFANNKLRIYEFIENNIHYVNLLAEKHSYIALSHSFREINLNNKIGIESSDIWQEKTMKILARYWVFNYILKNYDFIMSDKSHTPKGKAFWKKLIDEALNNKMNVFVYNTKERNVVNITKINDINFYYGEGNSLFRFIIEK
jgi:hypothetical protein